MLDTAPAATSAPLRPVMAAPRYATPRTPSRASDGPRIGLVAESLGKAPMEWQQLVFDVANERDAFGRLVYELVVVTVPRQSGKTTLVGPVQIDRCSIQSDVKTFYTAQTGKDARSRFGDLAKLIKRSPLGGMVKLRYSAGDEGILFPNGSALKTFAPTESAIHGETPPLVTFDEIWEYDEALGDAMLEDAVLPAQITLDGNRQVWMISTAGTALSAFMRKWVDRGRAQVAAQLAGLPGDYPRMAYFEWSMPEGADPYDPEVLRSFHPAVGSTITVEALLATAKTTSRGKWLRSFCNVWTEAQNTVMPLPDWDLLAEVPELPPYWDQLAVTWDVAPDNELASIMASWRDADGTPRTRVVHSAPGTTWLVPLLARIHREWAPLVLGADDGGPTRPSLDELRRELGDDDPDNRKVLSLSVKDYATACASLLTMARDDKVLRHDGSRALRNAMAHLVTRKSGDAVAFSRSNSTGPIAALVATAVGLWLYDHREAPLGEPVFWSL